MREKTNAYDVVVVGAGNAALCAAISAHESGANVLVLEKGPQEKRGGTLFSRTVQSALRITDWIR